MGKGDLWDDSALISAFDDAITKYKVMHSKEYNPCSIEEGSIITNAGKTECTLFDENHKVDKDVETDNNSTVALHVARERGEAGATSVSPVEENNKVDAYAPVNYLASSNGVQLQNMYDEGNPNSQGVQEYNHLLNLYYELEEQRQKVMQQLHQVGNWNYHCSGEGSSSYSNSQVPTTQASRPTIACSYCPYACCQCSLALCPSVPAGSLDGTCGGGTCIGATAAGVPEKLFPFKDGDIVQIAMGAAEKLISSMEKKTSADFPVNEWKESEDGKNEGNMGQSAGSETDLTVVLNAWYSAGFHTGKYLVEQAIAKKQQG